MTTMPHNAELCSDSQCLLPMCVNWKMRNRLNGTRSMEGNIRTTSRNSSSHASATNRSNDETVDSFSGDSSSLQPTTKRKAVLEALRKKARKSSEEHSVSATATECDLEIHTSPQRKEPAQRESCRNESPLRTDMNISHLLTSGVLGSQNSAANHVPPIQSPIPDVSEAVSNMAAWLSLLASCTADAALPLPSPFDTTSESCSDEDFEQFIPLDLQCFSLPEIADMPCLSNRSVAPLNASFPVPDEYATGTSHLSDDTLWMSWQCNTPLTMQTTQKCDAALACRPANLMSPPITIPAPTINANPSQAFMANIARAPTELSPGDNIAALAISDATCPTVTAQTDTSFPILPESSSATCGSSLPMNRSITSNSGQDIGSPLTRAVHNCISRVFTILDRPRSDQLERRLTSILEETVLKLESAMVYTKL